MKCLNQHCNADNIQEDDNFCYKCGHWTAKGFSIVKEKKYFQNDVNGEGSKKDARFYSIIAITSLTIFAFIIMTFIKGNDLYKPFFYLKREYDSFIYGYNTSIIKTDNIYSKKIINNKEDAIELIKKDFESQGWKCIHYTDTLRLQYIIENNGSIPAVSFCDMSFEEVEKVSSVINKMYSLFPNIKGALTNISISNAKTNSEYIARFQPMYQFANSNEDIKEYNKVNKTQILLNSYYFLNDDIMKNPVTSVVGEDWYVKDVTWESTIAHELGHYISFVVYLKEKGLKDIIFVTKENEETINNLMKEYDTGNFSKNIVNEALNNYNSNYNDNLDINTFAETISKYAANVDKYNNLIYGEIIAEAIHDYYLHENSCSKSSYEIVKIIKLKL